MRAMTRRYLWVLATICTGLLLGWRMAIQDTPYRRAVPLRSDVLPDAKMTVRLDGLTLPQACLMYADLTGRILLPRKSSLLQQLDDLSGKRLRRWHVLKRPQTPPSGIEYHGDGSFSALEVKERLENYFRTQGLMPVAEGRCYLRLVAAVSQPRLPNKALEQ
jgi:hypothetical protein